MGWMDDQRLIDEGRRVSERLDETPPSLLLASWLMIYGVAFKRDSDETRLPRFKRYSTLQPTPDCKRFGDLQMNACDES